MQVLKTSDHSSIEITHESLTLFNDQKIVLPGGMCTKLAQLLGLKSSFDFFFVKCRMIHYSINAGLYGAASCFCFCLLMVNYELMGIEKNGSEDQIYELSLNVLKNVLRLVKSVSFTDCMMKKELTSGTYVCSY